MTEKMQQTIADASNLEVLKINPVIDSMNHAQRSALVSKFEMLKKAEKEQIAGRFAGLNKLEQYIAYKMHGEANNKLTSERMPNWRATIATFAPMLESQNSSDRSASLSKLETLRDELEAADAAVDVVRWYKVKRDTSSKDAHIVSVCKLFNIDPASIA